MDASTEKKELRRLALARRDALCAESRAAASAEICRLLAALPELCEARTVLGYAAVGSECDLSALYETLAARGVRLAFPVCGADGRHPRRSARPRALLDPGARSVRLAPSRAGGARRRARPLRGL